MKRVYCLYRVSTLGQVDREKDDIPMQKTVCREFAQKQGWVILKGGEFEEKGISGYKVSAKDRDAILEIQEAALEKKFDILLVFMFDRLGRRDDETPFIVEWFVQNGVEVWSATEGQQRFDSHVDKLMNYIRFWQASGESIKTQIRTKAGMAQLVLDGHFRGGNVPYGYKLVKNGRRNKRNEEVCDIEVDPYEAEIVKHIFQKYVYEGYGINRLIDYLFEQGIYNHNGNKFSFSSTRSMIQNPLYIGILTSGDTRSDVIGELKIIDNDLFDRAQMIRTDRSKKREDILTRCVPLNTNGRALVAGKVCCAHCGGRLSVATAVKKRTRADGTVAKTRQFRYKCHSKNLKLRDCDGQTGYSMEKIDGIVTGVLLDLFSTVKALPVHELVEKRYQSELSSCENKLKGARKELVKHTDNLKALQDEVLKVINGTSAFDRKNLNDVINKTKDKVLLAEKAVQQYEEELASSQKYMTEAQAQYNEVITWSDMFQNSTLEKKKMIAAYLIDRVDVGRDYKINIKFNIAYEQFSML